MNDPASRQCDVDEDYCTLEQGEVTWKEPEEEESKTAVGSARNHYYYGEGRVVNQRLLSIFATLDQEQLAWQQNTPAVIQAPLAPPPLHQDRTSLLESSLGASTENNTSSMFEALPSGSFTRILEVLPGTHGPIESNLHIANVRDCRFKYEALSYSTIGDAMPRSKPQLEPLICNGGETMCKRNLVHALERLRLPDRSRLLWAADLCVDLNAVTERNNHVWLSKLIFRNAERVTVWLGPDMDHSEKIASRAFRSICKVVNMWRTQSQLTDRIPSAEFSAEVRSDIHIPRFGRMSDPSYLQSPWFPVIELFRCRWFGRTWSISEVALARVAVVQWGDCQISWDWIGLAAAVMRENYGRIGQDWRPDWSRMKRPIADIGVLQAYFMYRVSLSQQYFEPRKVIFRELQCLTRTYKCRVDHDKVFALLGVPTLDDLSSQIMPDYSREATSVNQEVFAFVTRTSQSLALLATVQNEHSARYMLPGSIVPRHLVLSGPSWCPHWNFHPNEVILPLQPCPEFSAATALKTKISFSNDKSRLATAGILVDTVARSDDNAMLGTFWRGRHETPGPSSHNLGSSSLESILSQGEITPLDLEHLVLVLTCGKDWDGWPVKNIRLHVADYARCLLKDGLLWSLSWIIHLKSQGATGPWEHSQETRITLPILEQLSQGGNADRFLDAAATVGHERAHFVTKSGFWGIGPSAIVEGDVLCTLHGAGVPFIIHPRGDAYQLVGECYVHGIMRGEIVESLQARDSRLQETVIQLV